MPNIPLLLRGGLELWVDYSYVIADIKRSASVHFVPLVLCCQC